MSILETIKPKNNMGIIGNGIKNKIRIMNIFGKCWKEQAVKLEHVRLRLMTFVILLIHQLC